MATGPTREIVHFADAMRMSVELAGYLESDIHRHVEELEDGGNRESLVRAIGALWSLVDVTNRLRDLIQEAPKLRKRQPAVQLFLRNTTNVGGLRNYIQHLRREIHKLPSNCTPIWGVLGWVSPADPNMSFTAVTGSPHPQISVYTIALDTQEMRFAQTLMLSVNNVLIDVPPLMIEIRRIAGVVEEWASAQGCPLPPARVSLHSFRIGRPPA